VSSIKNDVVSFFPDLPSPNNEYFHEEFRVEWFPHFFHHEVKLEIKSLWDTQMLPAPSTKRAREEEVEGGFFTLGRAEDTIVIIILEFVLLSSENISDIQPVHEQKPCEDFYLVSIFGVPNPHKGLRGLTFL
jgi:hypothetical protein